jgi:predicted ribosomally synthesized peptide with nif11-like leader
MSDEHVKRFLEELARDAGMQGALTAARSQDELIANAVRLAAERGLQFSPAEFEAYLRRAAPASGELSEEHLDAIAGGESVSDTALLMETLSSVLRMLSDTNKAIVSNIR